MENTKSMRTSDSVSNDLSPNVFSPWVTDSAPMKYGWIVRNLLPLDSSWNSEPVATPDCEGACIRAGDVLVVRVTHVANHTRLFTANNEYSRLYEKNCFLGVAGSRYATDAFHATEIDPRSLHLLTNAGLLGTVREKHRSKKGPTTVDLIGCLVDETGKRVNLTDRYFHPLSEVPESIAPVLTVGTGMNSGKTTSTARLGQALQREGVSVAIVKLTGSASHRDVHEFRATGAVFSADFSDYGFPSTYLATPEALEGLYCRMMTDAAAYDPDVVLVEIADGVFQRETEMLLRSNLVRATAAGVVLTAACAPSALCLNQAVEEAGWNPIAVTGLITNAPLFVDEFRQRCDTPIFNTSDEIGSICEQIIERIKMRQTVPSPAMV